MAHGKGASSMLAETPYTEFIADWLNLSLTGLPPVVVHSRHVLTSQFLLQSRYFTDRRVGRKNPILSRARNTSSSVFSPKLEILKSSERGVLRRS